MLRACSHTYSFNPCSNGITTRDTITRNGTDYDLCFNPCSNGITTREIDEAIERLIKTHVSILVLMELLRETNAHHPTMHGFIIVSILVLMELLREIPVLTGRGAQPSWCFNPCSNGITTREHTKIRKSECEGEVSILVLMELLREIRMKAGQRGRLLRFNPCSNGITTRDAFPFVYCSFTDRVSILVLMELLRERRNWTA